LIGHSIEDIENVFKIVDGECEFDSNCLSFKEETNDMKKIRVGIAKEFLIKELSEFQSQKYESLITQLESDS